MAWRQGQLLKDDQDMRWALGLDTESAGGGAEKFGSSLESGRIAGICQPDEVASPESPKFGNASDGD